MCAVPFVCRLNGPGSLLAGWQLDYRETLLPNGTWIVTFIGCVPHAASGLPPTLVADEARKLLPTLTIGSAPGGKTIVNMQTILWLDTSADRTLGTVALLGRRVAIRAHLHTVDWDFGDATADTATTPGREYTEQDQCTTRICDGFFGHVYTHAATATITATSTWTGEYSVDGGPWLDIPGTVQAPTSTTELVVREARSVLVTDPPQ